MNLFVSHDGAVDDFIALALTAVSPEVDLIGVQLVEGDCLAEPALRAQRKLLEMLGRGDVPQSLSRCRALNPFPWEYRADCVAFEKLLPDDDLPTPTADGEAHLRRTLEEATAPVAILALGPLTPLRLALEDRPELMDKIERLVWMGGAVDVPGNLDPATLPGVPVGDRAEWNAFWDPPAADWIFRNLPAPITLAPLDIANQAPISEPFLGQLAAADTPVARIASDAYRRVADQPYYRLWDVAAAAYVVEPTVFAAPIRERLQVVVSGPDQGATMRASDGREVDVLAGFADEGPERFYRAVAKRLSLTR